jgi:mediator of RNA polymerase II transcription subunit 16
MTSEKMPLMLDNPMPVDLNDVDDLFGDAVGVGVGLSLPERAQSKQLQQRMDDIRIRGCCQYEYPNSLTTKRLTRNRAVAWSRTGTIANITSDGQNVELRYLRRSPDDGSWDLSDPTTCPFVNGTPAVPIVHLTWAGTSTPDLAVIDAAGRVTIVSFSISLNHPFVQRKWDADPIDDVHAIVGAYWLTVAPSNQQVCLSDFFCLESFLNRDMNSPTISCMGRPTNRPTDILMKAHSFTMEDHLIPARPRALC